MKRRLFRHICDRNSQCANFDLPSEIANILSTIAIKFDQIFHKRVASGIFAVPDGGSYMQNFDGIVNVQILMKFTKTVPGQYCKFET